MTEITITSAIDFDALALRWRELEQRANGSFFQSWTWVGCCLTERFPDPVLVEAIESGRTVALGLFNRVRRWFALPRLHLNETGHPEQDTPYVEQNGILTEAGRELELTERCLRPLAVGHDLVISGVGTHIVPVLRKLNSLALVDRISGSPFVDLTAIQDADDDYLRARSANTRAQIRRSDRFYEKQGGIHTEQAITPEAAHIMLDELAALHQATWCRRGLPGSFAEPFFRRFHHYLIDRGLPRDEILLLKITSGASVIGYLYSFIWRQRLSAYQSGFAYLAGSSHAKPGLTCHHAAIRRAIAHGIVSYDFLAGDDRYKRSLADQHYDQCWVHAGPIWSPTMLIRASYNFIRSAE